MILASAYSAGHTAGQIFLVILVIAVVVTLVRRASARRGAGATPAAAAPAVASRVLEQPVQYGEPEPERKQSVPPPGY
jgi:hypothetical protein